MAHDQDGNVSQSFSFSIFLINISILFIILPLIINSLLEIVLSLISASDKLKIFSAFNDVSGIIG